ncbi:MBL fold metallo-hydrolase [Propionibacteriaceae bacterium Y2011]
MSDDHRDHRHHVSPGGDTVDLPGAPAGITVTKFSVGEMDNNCYLLRSDDALIMIDAATDAERIVEVIGPGTTPDVVVTTHRHHDHIGALPALAEHGRPRLYAGTLDVAAITVATMVSDLRGVWDGDVITAGDISLEVIGLMGHTPGAIALLLGDALLFTGDSLFPGGPGRTRTEGDFGQLMDDLETKVFDRFADDVAVHPGHGDSTTLGAERPQLGTWRERGW